MVRKQIATRHTHDVFCKTVIGHAAIDAARSICYRRPFESCLSFWEWRYARRDSLH